MRKARWLFLLLVAALLGACGQPASQAGPAPSTWNAALWDTGVWQ